MNMHEYKPKTIFNFPDIPLIYQKYIGLVISRSRTLLH